MADTAHHNENIIFSREQAYLNIFCSLMYADGEMTEKEVDELMLILSVHEWFNDVDKAELLSGFRKLYKEYEQDLHQIIKVSVSNIDLENYQQVYNECLGFVKDTSRVASTLEHEMLRFISQEMGLNADLI